MGETADQTVCDFMATPELIALGQRACSKPRAALSCHNRTNTLAKQINMKTEDFLHHSKACHRFEHKPKKDKVKAIGYSFTHSRLKKQMLRFTSSNGKPILRIKFFTSPDYSLKRIETAQSASKEKENMLTNYDDFVTRVDALGFMSLSPLVPGLPSLGEETEDNLWHTGLDTDPWRWKDRVAEEKLLAYGCILGGHKGFVTQRMYPIFYAAFHPSLSMPERWASGIINQATWQLWQLFKERGVLTTSQARKALGASSKQAARAIDAALQQLQHEYYITVDGNERKISAKGEFYGWPVNRYRRVTDWAPTDWLDGAKDWSAEGAREVILDDGVAMSKDVNRQMLAKKLGWR
jgi:hypothetical protein